MLKRNNWTRKEARWLLLAASQSLRQHYLKDVGRFNAEDLVFLDESIFNKKTSWRHQAYAPIGHKARYKGNT